MLTFLDAVHRYFDPLACRHGLRCVRATSQFARFESKEIFLQVQFDKGWSFQLGVEIGRLPVSASEQERPFDLAEVLRLRGSPDAAYVSRLLVSQSDVLVRAIERLALLTDEHAKDLLDGKAWDFAQLARFRDRETSAYALSHTLHNARRDAERAWARKDYAKVVRSYELIESHLTASESKRLGIAKGKMSEEQ